MSTDATRSPLSVVLAPSPGVRNAQEGQRGVAMAVLAADATEREVRSLVESLRTRGLDANAYEVGQGVLLLHDVRVDEAEEALTGQPAVERVSLPGTRYRLARRDAVPSGSVVRVGGVPFGSEYLPVIAGPCAVESRDQILTIARATASAGASLLRGGAFKPRTSPYDFQGLELLGLELLDEARDITGLPIVTEVMSPGMIEPMYGMVDAFQVGSRNMQNYELLKALADIDKPVLLKRGFAATVDEWLLAAEYLLAGGNEAVILCERGIRAFAQRTRFTLDLASVALAKRETHLPVIVDPSHATGDRSLVAPMALAAVAAGADGIMVEVHNDPRRALSDGQQALRPAELSELLDQLEDVGAAVGRRVLRGPLVLGGAQLR